MAIVKALVCDSCGVTFQTDIESADKARQRAKKTGWIYLRGTVEFPASRGVYADYCPECQEGDR